MGRLCPARCQPALGVRAQNGSFHGHKAVGAAEAMGGQWGAAKAVGWEVGVQPRLWGGKWGVQPRPWAGPLSRSITVSIAQWSEPHKTPSAEGEGTPMSQCRCRSHSVRRAHDGRDTPPPRNRHVEHGDLTEGETCSSSTSLSRHHV